MPAMLGSGSGRFLPLAYKEFNLFITAGNTPYLYYLLQALKLGITILMLAFTLRFIQRRYTHLSGSQSVFAWLGLCLSLVIFITAPQLFTMFADVMHLESMLIPCLSVFFYFYLRAIKTDKIFHYALSLIFGNLAIYLKEPVFGALLILIATPYLFSRSEFSRRRTIFSFCIVLSGLVYLLLYYLLVFKGVENGFYNSGRNFGRSPFELILLAVRMHPIALLLGGIALVRSAFIFRKQDAETYIFDGFLFAGLAYSLAFILLNMDARRYMSTLYIFAIPAIFFYFASTLNRPALDRRLIPASILLLSLGLLLAPHWYSWNQQIKYSQTRRLDDLPKLSELAGIADGNKIYLLGKPDSARFIKHRVRVLNRFFKTYGYDGSVEHTFDIDVLHDSQDELVVLVSSEIASEARLKKLLEAGNFQYRLTFWYRIDAYSNFPTRTGMINPEQAGIP